MAGDSGRRGTRVSEREMSSDLVSFEFLVMEMEPFSTSPARIYNILDFAHLKSLKMKIMIQLQ